MSNENLESNGIAKEQYGEKYQDHILEQYKAYLTTTDKVSERRSTANTFFLAVNVGLISAIGFGGKTDVPPILYILIGFANIFLCLAWYNLINSYRALNTAKFEVILEMENKFLPLRPLGYEWDVLQKGENSQKYRLLTKTESYIPQIFMVLYVFLIGYGIYLIFK